MDKAVRDKEDHFIEELLRQSRVKQKLTQLELAAALGCSRSSVSKYERGHHHLHLPEVRLICQALGIPLGRFIKKYQAAVAAGHLPETVATQRVRRKTAKTEVRRI